MERLALIEVLDHDGRVLHAVPIMRWPVSIGRALDCDVVLHDPHVAAHHATIGLVADPTVVPAMDPTPGPAVDSTTGPAVDHDVDSATGPAFNPATGPALNPLAGPVSGPVSGPVASAVANPVHNVVPTLRLVVGESVNGVRWPGRELAAGASALLPPGTIWYAGGCALRIRLPGETLPAEVPIAHPARRHHTLLTIAATFALLLWIATQQWLESEPDSTWDKYLSPLIGIVTGLAAWSVLWGLGSKLFQRRFRPLPHFRVVVGFVLAGFVIDTLLALGAFALSWPWLSHIRGWVEVALLAALLATHVALLAPGHARTVGLIFGVLGALSIGINAALTWRSSERLFSELYVATLPPPSLRLVAARPTAALIEQLRPLKEVLDRRAKEDEDKEGGDAF